MWVVDLLDLVDADFRHLHQWPPDWGPGIADGHFPPAMGAEQFFRTCEALIFQTGSAVRGWLDNENARHNQQDARGTHGHPTPGQPPARAAGAPPRDLDQLAMSEAFRGDGTMPSAIGRMKKRT